MYGDASALSMEMIKKIAHVLYAKYIAVNSEMEVNISSRLRNKYFHLDQANYSELKGEDECDGKTAKLKLKNEKSLSLSLIQNDTPRSCEMKTADFAQVECSEISLDELLRFAHLFDDVLFIMFNFMRQSMLRYDTKYKVMMEKENNKRRNTLESTTTSRRITIESMPSIASSLTLRPYSISDSDTNIDSTPKQKTMDIVKIPSIDENAVYVDQ